MSLTNDSKLIELLISLLNDENQSVKLMAILILGELGEIKAKKVLEQIASQDNKKKIRVLARDALENIKIVEKENSYGSSIFGSGADLFFLPGMLKNKDVKGLVQFMKNKDKPLATRNQAVQYIRKIGKPALKYLKPALKDKDRYVRALIPVIVGGINNKMSIEILTQSLKDKYWLVRKNAVLSLSMQNDASVIMTLISALNDKDSNVRWNAILGLGKLGDPKAIKPIIRTLHDKNKNVREIAKRVLDIFEKKKNKQKTPKEDIEKGRVKKKEAIGGDINEKVNALIFKLKDSDQTVSELSVQEMIALGKPAVEPLIQYLNHPDKWARLMAAAVLGKMGDLRAIEPLKSTLDDSDKGVRYMVQTALKELTQKGGFKTLDRCTHCEKEFYQPKTAKDKINFAAMQQVRVGCCNCEMPICFSCATTAADHRGKEGNCFCPKCGAELGKGGEAGNLGEHYSGWD